MADPRIEKRDAFLGAIAASPAVMGILNVTPDSFSDGGRHDATQDALAHARLMQAQGAAIIDIGAESTRPGASPVSQGDEKARLAPILAPLCSDLNVAVSIDTYKAAIAAYAADQGVSVINDIWGLQKDHDMAHVVADTGCAIVAMHNRDTADETIDILEDIDRFFEKTMQIAQQAGIREDHIILDPGFGFGKTTRQNYAILAGLAQLHRFGRPLLLGLSRKRMIGHALNADTDQRLIGTLGANMLGLTKGARVLRVHDVAEHMQTITIFNMTKASS
jgi:dihydropteroate synthase